MSEQKETQGNNEEFNPAGISEFLFNTVKTELNRQQLVYSISENRFYLVLQYQTKKWKAVIDCGDGYLSFFCIYPWIVGDSFVNNVIARCNEINSRLREGRFFVDYINGGSKTTAVMGSDFSEPQAVAATGVLNTQVVFGNSYYVLDEYIAIETFRHGLKLCVSVFISLWDDFYGCIH